MKRRRAISLVELLLAMSACIVILTMSAALVHRMMHAQTRTRAYFDAQRTSLRLTQRFRQDVHRAIDAEAPDAPDEEAVFLRLDLADKWAIEYRKDFMGIVRILYEKDAVRGREIYAFPPPVDVAVKRQGDRLIALNVTPGPDGPQGATAPQSAFVPVALVHAEAVLNRFSILPMEFSLEDPQ